MLKIGTKLRQLRDKHGYTQEQIADTLGMSQGNYSKLESNKYESFSWDILPSLANLYGVEITELLQSDSSLHINMSKNKDNAINAFLVNQNSSNENLIKSLRETIESQKEVITLQKTQIEYLEKALKKEIP